MVKKNSVNVCDDHILNNKIFCYLTFQLKIQILKAVQRRLKNEILRKNLHS